MCICRKSVGITKLWLLDSWCPRPSNQSSCGALGGIPGPRRIGDSKSLWITNITSSLQRPKQEHHGTSKKKQEAKRHTRVVTLQDGWARWSAGGQCCGSPQGRFVIPANRPRNTTVLQGESSFLLLRNEFFQFSQEKEWHLEGFFFVGLGFGVLGPQFVPGTWKSGSPRWVPHAPWLSFYTDTWGGLSSDHLFPREKYV